MRSLLIYRAYVINHFHGAHDEVVELDCNLRRRCFKVSISTDGESSCGSFLARAQSKLV